MGDKILETIGHLSFCQSDSLGSNRFGSIFQGTFQKTVEVAITKIEKKDFLVDAEVLGRSLNHQNILRFYGFEEDVDHQFLANELSAGTLLDLVMGDYKGPPVGTNRLVLKQVTKGLEYLHEKKIYHRELKPSHVFISHADGTVRPMMKLGNFGIYANTKESNLLIELAGSRSWLPPEVYESLVFTAEMDLFALGCLYGFTLSRGRHPFGDDEEIRVSRIKKKESITLTIEHLKGVKDAAGMYQLICSLLMADPVERPKVSAVLKHSFFVKPKASKEQEESSEHESKVLHKRKNTDEEKNFKKLKKNYDTMSTYSSRHQDNGFSNSQRKAYPTRGSYSLLSPPNSSRYGYGTKEYRGTHNTDNFSSEFLGRVSRRSSRPPSYSKEGIQYSKDEEELLKLCSCERLSRSDLARLRQIVNSHADINCKTPYGETPLLLLCTRNQTGSLYYGLEILLNRADVNLEATYCEHNALTLMSRFYHHQNLIHCVRLLIKRGISVDKTDRDGQNALSIICQLHNGEDLIDVCRLLVRKMTDLHAAHDSAYILVDRGFPREGEILLGIIENLRDNCEHELSRNEETLFQLCSIPHPTDNDLDHFQHLVLDKEIDPNKQDASSRTPLQILFYCNHSKGRSLFRMTRALLQRNCVDLQVKDEDDWNVLLAACFFSCCGSHLFDIVRLLVDHGIDLRATNRRGWTVLHALCCRPNQRGFVPDMLEIIQFLLYNGVNLHTKSADGSNALSAFVSNHYNHPQLSSIVRLMVLNCIDVNAVNFVNQNTLAILCSKYDGDERELFNIAKLLIEHGIDVHHRDINGHRAVDFLLKRRGYSESYEEIIRLIRRPL